MEQVRRLNCNEFSESVARTNEFVESELIRLGYEIHNANENVSNLASVKAVKFLFRKCINSNSTFKQNGFDISNSVAFSKPTCFSFLPSTLSNPISDLMGIIAENNQANNVEMDIFTLMTGDGISTQNNRYKDDLIPWHKHSGIPSKYLNNGKRRFVVYQSRGVRTGKISYDCNYVIFMGNVCIRGYNCVE